MKKFLLVFGLILGTAIFLTLYKRSETIKLRHGMITTFSRSLYGLSVFSELSKKRDAFDYIEVNRISFLDPTYEGGTIFLQAPKRPVSAHEAEELYNLVKDKGVTLVTTFHTKESFSNLRILLRRFFPGISPTTREGFVNHVSSTVPLGETNFPILQDVSDLTLYGNLRFDTETCAPENCAPCSNDQAGCFIQTSKVGKGRFLAFASLSPLTNALIGKGQNWKFAENILQSNAPIILDEYHNWFSEYTIWDLFLLPDFALPLVAFFLFLILYLLFSYNGVRGKGRNAPSLVKSVHDVNSSLFLGFLSKERSLRGGEGLVSRRIERLFPEALAELEKISNSVEKPRTKILGLIRLHQKLRSCQ